MNKNLIGNIFWFLIACLELKAVWSQKAEIIDCTNEEMVTSVFNEPMDLTLRGVIKVYENVTINEILSTTNNEFEINYIDARLEPTTLGNSSKNLVLFTTKQFENYAREQTAARISLKLNLGCGMGKERVVIFFQPLKEGNYFSPIFSKSVYEIFIPTPIFVGFDLTAFHEITATDDDLTHNQIDFTSNDSSLYHLSVGTKNTTTIDKKTYFAKVTLKKILLELPQPITIQIKATDNGTPPKSSMASVIIRADPEHQLPIQPKFKQALYKSMIEFDLSMPAITIEMLEGTYSPEIIFSLRGVSIKGFHLEDHKNGSIEVQWNAVNLNRSEIIKHAKWELELRAEHINLAEFGRATVIVELADFQNYFRFMTLYQEGYIDEIGELHMDPVIFNPATYQSDMHFELLTSYDFFRLSIKNYTIQVQLNQNFTWQAVDDMEFLKLTLKASWESLSSVMHIVIKLPQIKDKIEPQKFQFEKPLYVGQLNATGDLEMETIRLQTDVDNEVQHDVKLSLSGNGSSEFYILYNGSAAIEIKTNFSTAAISNEYFLVLEAKANELKTFSTLVIKKSSAAPVVEAINKNIFLNPMAMGQIMYDNVTMLQSYKGESIYVSKNVKENLRDLKFNLSGDFALNFNVKINFSISAVDLELKMPMPVDIMATKQFLNLSLQAFLQEPEMLNDTARIFIALPIKECPAMEPSQPDSLRFSSSSYVFTTFTNQTGLLGIVNAFSRHRNVSIHYMLEVQNDNLAQRLSIGPFSGEIFLYGAIDEGNYLFNITAESKETHEKASVKAVLKVQRKEECKLYEGPTVEKTIMVRHVEEEKPFYGLLDLKFNENCSFYIEDIRPNDKEYVHVNYIFNMLDVIALDREDPIFENKLEPEIMVKLRLKCDTEAKHDFLDIDMPKPEERALESIGIWDDVSYNPDVMWLFIKIDDVNDNAPQFNYTDGPLYLGYPSKDDSLEIYPEYLCQMKAFDHDVGINARIKYSMRENLYFGIEPLTGKIYPKGKFLENEQQVELIVLATDQYGEGLTAGMVIIVKALTRDFYSLITLNENSVKTPQEVELLLTQETGYDIKVLKMTYVPLGKQPRSSDNQSLSCKAWIYAYQRHNLVPFKEMQEQILVENPSNNILNIQSYEAAAYYAHKDEDNHMGYIVATILLSLISCCSLAFIIWRHCYKSPVNFKGNKKSSAPSSENNKNGNVKSMPATCSHGCVKLEDCKECHTIEDNNCVKFSDLVENVIVEDDQSK